MVLSDLTKKILQILLLLVLPWVAIIAVLAVSFLNVWVLLAIVLWIGAGIVFYSVFAQEST
jgi:hypothetical protein